MVGTVFDSRIRATNLWGTSENLIRTDGERDFELSHADSRQDEKVSGSSHLFSLQLPRKTAFEPSQRAEVSRSTEYHYCNEQLFLQVASLRFRGSDYEKYQ